MEAESHRCSRFTQKFCLACSESSFSPKGSCTRACTRAIWTRLIDSFFRSRKHHANIPQINFFVDSNDLKIKLYTCDRLAMIKSTISRYIKLFARAAVYLWFGSSLFKCQLEQDLRQNFNVQIGVLANFPHCRLIMTKICDFSYPIHDLTKNLISYLWPYYTCTVAVNINLWRAFVAGFT